MSLEQIRFSRQLQRQQHLHAHARHTLRLCAFCLTLGEVLVCFVLFRRLDYVSAYATAAYLAKEHVISRFLGGK